MSTTPPQQSTVDLTIIIPVYNALPYFHKCIESITSQDTWQYSVEVILVDDGSTDGSGEYCDEAASQWSYIRTIHIESSGMPARPRNIGIEESDGNYIFFCDADDYFEENALAPMLDHAYEDKCDVGLFKIVGENGRSVAKVYDSNKSWKHCTVSDYKGGDPYFLRAIGPTKLFERRFIERYEIRFPESVAPEDFPFMLECYFKADNICIYNDQVYYHVVRRDDDANLSLGNVSLSSFWTKPESHLASLENCFSIASQYTSPNECPEVYRRIISEPLSRILLLLKAESPEYQRAVVSKIRKCFYPCKNSEPLRQILGLRNIVLLDALFLCNNETFLEIFYDWPIGFDISFSTLPSQSLSYIIHLNKDDSIIVQASLPLDPKQDDQPIQSPNFLKNQITHLQTTAQAIEIAGHVNLLRRSERGEFTAKLRTNFFDGGYDRWFENVDIQNVSSENVYASVYQIEFDWNVCCPFKALIPEDSIDPSRIYFFLDIEFDTGEIISNRIGHNRIEGIYPNFISQAVWHDNHLFAPYETKYKNLSCRVHSDAKLIKRTEIKLLSHDGGWYLDVQGQLNFDNYPSTQIELAFLDTNGKTLLCFPLEKGDSIKNRKFNGSFKLDDLDGEHRKGIGGFELSVTVKNKTFRSKDIELTYSTENKITYLQTSNEAIEIAGHVNLLRRSERGEFTAKLRTNFFDGGYDRWFENVDIQNVSSENVYASVYQIEFDWNVCCPFKALIPEDSIDPSRIYFFLDIEFDTGEIISNRIGHNRIEGIYPNFISQAVWHDNHLFAPYETKCKNLSFYVYSNIQLIKTTGVGFRKRNSSWYLDVQGQLNFDNYPSTQIELAFLDTNGKTLLCFPLEKGDSIKNRKFNGSFKLDDLGETLSAGTYIFELRVTVTNKTFYRQDFAVSENYENSTGHNCKQGLLYATNADTLFFKYSIKH